MGIIGGQLGYQLLRFIAPRGREQELWLTTPSEPDAKLKEYFGDEFFGHIVGKTVIDFGCGSGRQAIAMARGGARLVVGLDIQQHLLDQAKRAAEQSGVADRCLFTTQVHEPADIIVSKDAFEHFADPAAVLRVMSTLVRPDGCVLAAFGPTWLHPYGGHLFSVFPWSHLIFTERAQIRWRSDFKDDGASRFSEVSGGLNQLTIGAFERIVSDSPFRFDWMETVPVRGLRVLRSRLLREIGSAIVRCRLVPKTPAH